MAKKVYQGALFGLLVWPLLSIVFLTQLDPSSVRFPLFLKLTFLVVALFAFSLNYVVDYQKDNRKSVQLIVRFNGLIPFLVILPYYPDVLILETPLLVWFGFLFSVYMTLLNHFSLFSKNEKRLWERLGSIIALVSFGIGLAAILSGNAMLFSAWLWSIVSTVLAAFGLFFSKRRV